MGVQQRAKGGDFKSAQQHSHESLQLADSDPVAIAAQQHDAGKPGLTSNSSVKTIRCSISVDLVDGCDVFIKDRNSIRLSQELLMFDVVRDTQTITRRYAPDNVRFRALRSQHCRGHWNLRL